MSLLSFNKFTGYFNGTRILRLIPNEASILKSSIPINFSQGSTHIAQSLPANDRLHSSRWLHLAKPVLRNLQPLFQIFSSGDGKLVIVRRSLSCTRPCLTIDHRGERSGNLFCRLQPAFVLYA